MYKFRYGKGPRSLDGKKDEQSFQSIQKNIRIEEVIKLDNHKNVQ